MSNSPIRIKRFYETVSVELYGGAYVICLDGRNAKTKAHKVLMSTAVPLAQAVANEWTAQNEFIDRQTMPLTAMLSAAIDGGADGGVEWLQDVLDYLGSDLVCYRAASPHGLVQRQSEVWDPYIDFMKSEFDATLVKKSGLVAVAQPNASIDAVQRALNGQSAETLFAIRTACAIAGSAVLSLALWKGFRDASIIFEASRVDERFQEESWGIDEEAHKRENNMRNDFLIVSQFLSLI